MTGMDTKMSLFVMIRLLGSQMAARPPLSKRLDFLGDGKYEQCRTVHDGSSY